MPACTTRSSHDACWAFPGNGSAPCCSRSALPPTAPHADPAAQPAPVQRRAPRPPVAADWWSVPFGWRLDHPVDHPGDPTEPFSIRLGRRGIRPEQGRSVWSRPDRPRAPGYGCGGQAKAGAGRCRTLRSRSWSDIGGDSGRCCCRLSSVALPQGLHDAAAVAGVRSAGRLRLPVSTSRVHCRRVWTVDVRRLRGPGPEPQQVSAEPDTAAVPRYGWAYGRLLSGTAAVHRGHHRSPFSRGGTPGLPVADIHAHPPAAAVGTGSRPPTLPGCPGCFRHCGHLAMPSRRLDGGRTAGVRSAAELHAASVRCPPLRPQPPPVSGQPVSTADPAAVCGVRRYRNRSPARRPLEGCRHRW
jgi:hypothetical protein